MRHNLTFPPPPRPKDTESRKTSLGHYVERATTRKHAQTFRADGATMRRKHDRNELQGALEAGMHERGEPRGGRARESSRFFETLASFDAQRCIVSPLSHPAERTPLII